MAELRKNEIVKEGGISTLKGLIGAIPFAGTAINEVFFEIRGRIKQNRVNTFVEELAKYLEQFSKEEIKLDQIGKDEFGDFFEDLIIKVSKTNSITRRKVFQNLLVNQLTHPKEIEYSNLFLEIAGNLQEKQIPILHELNEDYPSIYIDLSVGLIEYKRDLKALEKALKTKRYSDIDDDYLVYEMRENEINKLKNKIEERVEIVNKHSQPFQPETYNCDKHEFLYLIQDLANKGLLIDTGITYGANPYDLVEITDFGMDFIEYIKEVKPAANNA